MQKAPAARASVLSKGRFELPQLTPVNYSLTDGTDIPPPPESPVENPSTPPLAGEKADETATSSSSNDASNANGGVYEGRGRTSNADHDPPLSPASTTRPGSIRRFLSRRSLNSNYTNGSRSADDLNGNGGAGGAGGERPGSAMAAPKRSKSWFRRLGNSSSTAGNGNRTSVVYENGTPPPADQQPEKKGPPPPKLPELNQLKAKIEDDDAGSLGAEDMFKNIK